MTDSISDSDIRRADENVDPTALSTSDIESALPDDFSRSAKQAFADRISAQREQVRESVDLSNRISRNPSSGQPQLRGPDGRLGPSSDAVVGTSVDNQGNYYAELDSSSSYAEKHDTDRFLIDTVDLDAGADNRRQDNW